MDLYLNLHSTDLGDSNNESTYMASKVLENMLSEWRTNIDDRCLSLFAEDILLKLIMNTPNHAEQEHVVASDIIESITRLLSNTQDLALLQDILRLLMNMIDQSWE